MPSTGTPSSSKSAGPLTVLSRTSRSTTTPTPTSRPTTKPSPTLSSLFGLIGDVGTVAGWMTVSLTTALPLASVCSVCWTTWLNLAAT